MLTDTIDANDFYKGSIPLAIERYLIGLDAMSKYLAEENLYTNEDGIEFILDRALFNGYKWNYYARHRCELSSIDLKLADNYTSTIKVSVSHEGKQIGGLSLLSIQEEEYLLGAPQALLMTV